MSRNLRLPASVPLSELASVVRTMVCAVLASERVGLRDAKGCELEADELERVVREIGRQSASTIALLVWP